MTEQILVSLSIITAFHNKNHSILEAFLPLTEYGIALLCNDVDSNYFDTESLKERIEQSSGISINTLTLKTLLKKLKKENCVELFDHCNYFKVIISFKDKQDNYLAAINNSHRKVQKFIKEYKQYSDDSRSESELTVWIYEFICEYRRFIDVSNNNITTQFESQKYEKLLSFLSHINKCEQELINTFYSIYFGANIYFLINSTKATIAKKPLQELVVYLDSNFILRLMDLQEASFTSETTELFKTLKDNNIRLKIFDETVEEIKSVLAYYLSVYKNNCNDYKAIISSPENISGVPGAYFRRTLSFSQIEDIIDNVDSFINERGIMVDSLSRYKIEPSQDRVENLFKIKYEQQDNIQNHSYRMKKCEHYIQIIEVIKYLRNSSKYPCSCLGNSKYIFLTCDFKLIKYCRSITPNHYFPCIISQEMMANDLLLFAPNEMGQIALELLIALYNTSNYIDVHTLDKLKDIINDIARESPSDAKFIIAATRSCENYTRLADLLNDDMDDKTQLLEMAKEQETLTKENENILNTQNERLYENSIAMTKATEEIRRLEQQLKEASAREKDLMQQQKEKNKLLFADEMKSFIKKIKVVSVICCILFAIVAAIITLATTGWFQKPFKENWLAYVFCIIFFLGSIISGIYSGVDNRWLQNRIYKKEDRIAQKYVMDKCDIDNIRSLYWKHK